MKQHKKIFEEEHTKITEKTQEKYFQQKIRSEQKKKKEVGEIFYSELC